MKRIIRRNFYLVIFRFYSFTGIFIKNYNITKRKLILGSVILGLSSSIASCGNHTHKCYSAVDVNDLQIRDTVQTR